MPRSYHAGWLRMVKNKFQNNNKCSYGKALECEPLLEMPDKKEAPAAPKVPCVIKRSSTRNTDIYGSRYDGSRRRNAVSEVELKEDLYVVMNNLQKVLVINLNYILQNDGICTRMMLGFPIGDFKNNCRYQHAKRLSSPKKGMDFTNGESLNSANKTTTKKKSKLE